jgi:hypothetical protein
LVFTLRVNEINGEVDGYEFSGSTRFGKLFTGIAVECVPNGFGGYVNSAHDHSAAATALGTSQGGVPRRRHGLWALNSAKRGRGSSPAGLPLLSPQAKRRGLWSVGRISNAHYRAEWMFQKAYL